jgi:hypothetical protein
VKLVLPGVMMAGGGKAEGPRFRPTSQSRCRNVQVQGCHVILSILSYLPGLSDKLAALSWLKNPPLRPSCA